MNVVIVGAGPVGSYAAYLLVQKGFSVDLYDCKKKSQIGKPVQCTGIFPEEILNFLKLNDKCLINVISKIELCSKNRKAVFNKKEYVVDRTKFDKSLLDLAISSGVNFHSGHKLVGLKKNQEGKVNLIFKKEKAIKIVSPDLIIGADGPNSLLFRRLNKGKTRKNYYGVQARVKGDFDAHAYQTYFGSEFPNFFGWVVPESSTVGRVGLATLKEPAVYFDQFMKKLGIDKKQIVVKEGGVIPIFDSSIRFNYKNIYLLGDAAGWVKATTGGGIVPAFYEVHNLVNCLVRRKDYKSNSSNLKLHLLIRKVLNKFNDGEYDKLIGVLAKPRNKRLVENYSREKPLKLMWKLFLNEPKLAWFARKLV